MIFSSMSVDIFLLYTGPLLEIVIDIPSICLYQVVYICMYISDIINLDLT